MSNSRPTARGAHIPAPAPATTLALLVIAFPLRASASETEGNIGFELRLRPPMVMVLARHKPSRPAKAKVETRKDASPSSSRDAALPEAAPPAPAPEGNAGPDLGFDLLGPGSPTVQTPPVDEAKVKLRRKMLTYHPALGIGLLVCETATIVLGQLNYSDRFGGGPSSGRYERPHAFLAGTTGVLFIGTGLLAILAPDPMGKEHRGFDRVLLHKIGMFTATAGMLAEAVLGIYTTRREGYLNQESYAKAHLVIGYSTLAATYLGVGSIVF
jgi:hypothetical protein